MRHCLYSRLWLRNCYSRYRVAFHVAAIQRAFRAYLARRARPAAVIQRAWRAYLVRRAPPTAEQRAAACARRQRTAARRLRLWFYHRCLFRRLLYHPRRHRAALRIQAVRRGYVARCWVRKFRSRYSDGALPMQALWRGYKARLHVRALRARQAAVLCIQAQARRYLGASQRARKIVQRASSLQLQRWWRHLRLLRLRRSLRSLRERFTFSHQVWRAAVLLQAAWRGWLGRARARQVRAAHLARYPTHLERWRRCWGRRHAALIRAPLVARALRRRAACTIGSAILKWLKVHMPIVRGLRLRRRAEGAAVIQRAWRWSAAARALARGGARKWALLWGAWGACKRTRAAARLVRWLRAMRLVRRAAYRRWVRAYRLWRAWWRRASAGALLLQRVWRGRAGRRAAQLARDPSGLRDLCLVLRRLPPRALAERLAACLACWRAGAPRACACSSQARAPQCPICHAVEGEGCEVGGGEGCAGGSAGAGGKGGGGSALAAAPLPAPTQSAWMALPCGHALHSSCMMQWAVTRACEFEVLRSATSVVCCPLCRRAATRVVRWTWGQADSEEEARVIWAAPAR